MADKRSPTRPRNRDEFVTPGANTLSPYGLLMLEGLWRQIAAGHVIVPVTITQASVNVLVMEPELHEEGAATYANGLGYWGKTVAASNGAVTAKVKRGRQTETLDEIKVYITNGSAQAGAGDIALNGYYLFVYHEDLDGGAGGLVIQ